MIAYKIDNGYALYEDSILLPLKKKHPGDDQKFFRKSVPFEEAVKYWEYVKEGDSWNLYYVIRGKNRRLAVNNIGKYDPEAIIARIADKDITAADCNRVDEHLRSKRMASGPKLIVTVNWSVEFDEKSILELVATKPKMTFKDIMAVITNEGGYVDAQGIVHKGTAVNKIAEI